MINPRKHPTKLDQADDLNLNNTNDTIKIGKGCEEMFLYKRYTNDEIST